MVQNKPRARLTRKARAGTSLSMQFVLPFPEISPVLVEIPLGFTSLPIRWYALAYIAGFVAGYWLVRRAVDRPHLWQDDTPPMERAKLEDLLTYLIFGVILGGRLGYVLFYGDENYLNDPMAILRVWEGGMAFHGGFIGVLAAGGLFAWRNGINPAKLADCVAIAAPVGLAFGRIANFVNAELWGRPTDLPWGVIFPGAAAQNCPGIEELCARHPSQLYEAGLEGILVGAVVFWLTFRGGWLKKPGSIAGLFILGYGVSRFIVEFARQADPQFITAENPWGFVATLGPLGITRGQQLSLPMIALGLILLIWARRVKR